VSSRTLKIPIGKPDIGPEEIRAVRETLKSGWATQGRRVEELEKAFAEYCNVNHGVAVNTGTAALHTALAALGIGDGDEVITTPLSCIATTNPIRYLNARPVFVDVDSKTLNIDPIETEKKVSEKTKAILPVHLFGHPADMAPIMEIAERHDLFVIEDAAQAHGAKYRGRRVGSIGDVACFSFYADKLMTTVEGGIAVTNDAELAEKMRMLRNLGSDRDRKFHHPLLGYNYKMSDIHASIGVIQLKKLDQYILRKRRNVASLNRKLEDLDIKLPDEEDYAFNVYYVYHILVGEERERVKITGYLEREGVETRPLLSFIPEQPPYKGGYDVSAYPVARDAYRRGFYVSNSPMLTINELDFMASTLRKALTDR